MITMLMNVHNKKYQLSVTQQQWIEKGVVLIQHLNSNVTPKHPVGLGEVLQ